MYRCKTCLNTSSRPRITFNEKGICNACQWADEKKTIDWIKRQKLLGNYFKKKKKEKNYDCIIPVSGGKDGSYVSYAVKKKYNINPLCITIRPPLELNLGSENLSNFMDSGFDHLHITPNKKVMKELNYLGFKYMGFPYYGWLIAIFTSILKIASSININLIIYGEDGEVEYGGSNETKNRPFLMQLIKKKFILRVDTIKLLKK